MQKDIAANSKTQTGNDQARILVNGLPLELVRQWSEFCTKQITGKEARFWLYRKTGNDKGLSPNDNNKNNELCLFVQASKKPQKAFKLVAVDGQWVYAVGDHLRFLTKKRHRVDGVRVQGYTAKGVRLEAMEG